MVLFLQLKHIKKKFISCAVSMAKQNEIESRERNRTVVSALSEICVPLDILMCVREEDCHSGMLLTVYLTEAFSARSCCESVVVREKNVIIGSVDQANRARVELFEWMQKPLHIHTLNLNLIRLALLEKSFCLSDYSFSLDS